MKGLISFIVCTYNSPDLIKRCVDSILKQKYSGKKEILIIDGGSDQETIKLIRGYEREHREVTILNNKQKLPEGDGKGKWLGWKKCRGDYVFIIDQDNELIDGNCVENLLIPLKKEKVFGCACRLFLDKGDNLINQYVALVGTDPFFAYRSLDFLINFENLIKREQYSLFEIKKENIVITGGNCFVYNKKILDSLGGYVQDTENIAKLVKQGYNWVAISNYAFTYHSAFKGFFEFIKKKKKWARVYELKKSKNQNFSYVPKNRLERRKLILNLFFVMTLAPNLFISFKKIIKTREKIWLLHPALAFITGFIYFYCAFFKNISRI